MSLNRTLQLAGSFNTPGRRLGVAFPVLCLATALILGTAVTNELRAGMITVPNGDFETLYKPSTAITGVVSAGGWTQGVGPECPIDTGGGVYEFSDATTGDLADIPGWLGYDRQGWIDNGGTYGRDQTTGNLQGSISSQFNHTDGGSQCYLSNGAQWGNPAGGLIVSADPLATVQSGLTYTLSMVANGRGGGEGATPFVLKLLADGVELTPTSSVQPVLGDFEWKEVSRTYDAASLAGSVGKNLTIVLGVDRGCVGNQTQFDDVSLEAIPEPATLSLLALGSLIAVRRSKRR